MVWDDGEREEMRFSDSTTEVQTMSRSSSCLPSKQWFLEPA